MQVKTLKRTVVVALLATTFMQATPSYAQPTNTELTIQAQNLETKIQLLDNQIIESIEKAKRLNEEIKRQEASIVQIQNQIKDAEEDFEVHKELYFGRLQAIQEQGTSSFLTYAEILLNSEGFADFIQRTSAIAQFVDYDQEMLEGIREKESELKKKKQSLDHELSSLEKKKEELKIEQASIELAKKQVQTELSKTKDKIAKEEEARRRQAEQAEAQALLHSPLSTNPSPLVPGLNSSISPHASGKAKTVISQAQKHLGVPYVWGGATPSGFDCSGLTQYVYRSVGVELPRVSRDQQNTGVQIPTSQVQPGDLVFMGYPAYHVGIYIGNGKYLHAPQTGDVVKISTYNPSAFSSATRVLR